MKKLKNQTGQIVVIAIATLGMVLFIVLFVIAAAQLSFQNAAYSIASEKANSLAEAGIDKTLATFNRTGGNCNDCGQEVVFGEGSFEVKVTSIDAANKSIESTGYFPSKAHVKSKRTIKITASRGVGVAFNYGLQIGEGGLVLGNSNIVNGSVYSNGIITAGNSNQVSGDIWVAGGPQPSPDQQTQACDSCEDFLFGKSINGNAQLDVAQSFKPSQDGVLNKVSLKIKKVGSPSDLTVRILQDSGGKPDKNAVLTSGPLYAVLVTSNYPPDQTWIDVTFNSSPALTKDTTYWLMIDTQSDSSNYWYWQKVNSPSYSRGLPKWTDDWSKGNAIWDTISPDGDLAFKIYFGGAPTSVRADNNKMTVGGEVHANTIENLTIAKDAYYQTLITSTVSGASHPGSADPPPKVFPISDANISEWKNQARGCDSNGNNCKEQTGDITNCVTLLNSKKYIGNINFNSGCRVTVKTPIWITGNLVLNSNNILTLDSSYGSTSGAIIVDGTVTLNSNNHLNGTGTGSSLLMVLTTFDTSAHNGQDAVTVNSNGNTGVYYAGKGVVSPGTGNSFKELTAWGIKLINSSTIDYEIGLSSSLFTSGPSGSYSLVKGTYQIK